MKNGLRKIFKAVLTLVLILNLASFSYASTELKVLVNGRLVTFPDAQPYINEDSRTLVPVRFIAENMDCEVTWNGEIKQVSIKGNDKEIKLNIGESKATVNEEIITFDTKAIIKDDRTFVPLRFISETFGAEVDWNNESRAVFIDMDGLTDDGSPKDFIEPVFEVEPTQYNMKRVHCWLNNANYNEFKESEDNYYQQIIVLNDDKMNQSYTQIGQDWVVQDFTRKIEINGTIFTFRKFYIVEKTWDDDLRYRKNLGDIAELKVTIFNETKNIQRDYYVEVEAIKHLYGE